jgi:hypothetical protein
MATVAPRAINARTKAYSTRSWPGFTLHKHSSLAFGWHPAYFTVAAQPEWATSPGGAYGAPEARSVRADLDSLNPLRLCSLRYMGIKFPSPCKQGALLGPCYKTGPSSDSTPGGPRLLYSFCRLPDSPAFT